MIRLLLLLALSLSGCMMVPGFYDVQPHDRTPAGNGYTMADPLPVEYTRADVETWLDAQVDRWVARHAPRNAERLRELAAATVFVVHDDTMFPCDITPSGYCVGLTDVQCDTADVSVWRFVTLPGSRYAMPIADPQRLVRWFDGPTYHGWLGGVLGDVDPPGTATAPLFVIPHELDHQLGIHNGA